MTKYTSDDIQVLLEGRKHYTLTMEQNLMLLHLSENSYTIFGKPTVALADIIAPYSTSVAFWNHYMDYVAFAQKCIIERYGNVPYRTVLNILYVAGEKLMSIFFGDADRLIHKSNVKLSAEDEDFTERCIDMWVKMVLSFKELKDHGIHS